MISARMLQWIRAAQHEWNPIDGYCMRCGSIAAWGPDGPIVTACDAELLFRRVAFARQQQEGRRR